jgi:hypothetical protein
MFTKKIQTETHNVLRWTCTPYGWPPRWRAWSFRQCLPELTSNQSQACTNMRLPSWQVRGVAICLWHPVTWLKRKQTSTPCSCATGPNNPVGRPTVPRPRPPLFPPAPADVVAPVACPAGMPRPLPLPRPLAPPPSWWPATPAGCAPAYGWNVSTRFLHFTFTSGCSSGCCLRTALAALTLKMSVMNSFTSLILFLRKNLS